jgi:radical SAM protein (TIGR01212 family)
MYYSISQFYKQRFGAKVYKIPVSTASTCPNREGVRGMKTCNFCDEWGSAAYPEVRHLNLKEQIEKTRERLRARVHADKFLVYFQAYTNTFQKVSGLREQFAVSRTYPDIIGAIVGTRPDCLSPAVFDLWNEVLPEFYVGVELGVQTFDEDKLIWMRRGHSAEKSIEACHRIKDHCPQVDIGIHLMFGLPNETDADVIRTAKICNSLPIQNVKLHHLHVLHGTPLEQEFKQGLFTPLDLEAYVDRVVLFLQHLDPKIAVHRLSALSRRPEELVAPGWTTKKMEIYQKIINQFKYQKTCQGQALCLSNATHSPFFRGPAEV